MNLDYLYERLRRRTPGWLDYDTLAADYRTRTARTVADYRRRFPGTDAAVLEVTVQASGQTRRRLRRYREFAGARGPAGLLIIRQLTSLDESLEFKVIEIGTAAARAGVVKVDWHLLSVDQALAPAP